MEITRGSLDKISRPASNHNNRPRPGSRVSLNSAATSISCRRSLDTGSSLEILPPEDTLLQEHDIEVEDFSSSENDVEDDISDSEDTTEQGTFTNYHLALHLRDDDKESDTASSTPNVPNSKHTTDFRGNNDPESDANLDPKIAGAMQKMRQLDRILAKKMKIEKEVKRQRMELHRQLQRELEDAKLDGRDELREVSDNTIKFLALVPPSSHNEGIPLEDDFTPKSPVFATQPLDTDGGSRGNLGTDGNRRDKTGELSTRTSTHRSASSTTSNGQFGKNGKVNKENKKRRGQADGDKNKSNFIKRNIELANDAGNLIAMTDDEKKRLEDLLQDIEMLADEDWTSNQSQLQLQIAPGMGYQPDADEQKMLKDIDSRLQALMPAEDFMSIRSTPIRELTHGFEDISVEAFNLGEKVLQSHRQDRSQQEQLQRIEAELSQMQNAVEKEMKSPRISNERLSEILRQCDDLSSRATSATSSYIQLSPHSSWSVTDPDTTEEISHLPDDVLKYLLDEAREAGITTSTANEEEDEQDVVDFDNEPVTGRSTYAGALVSYDMIQELLRNPRATSVASDTSIPAIGLPRSDSDQTSPTGGRYRNKTPISPFSRSTSSLEVPLNDTLKTMGITQNGQRQLQDSQKAPSDTNRASVSSQRSSHDEESAAIYASTTLKSTIDFNQSPSLAAINSVSSSLEAQRYIRPPKTRDSSRIAFAESVAKTERKLLYSNGGDDSRQYTTIPTPPQISHTSPLRPQKSKLPSSPRSSKSKIKATSTQKSVPSPSQDAFQGEDLRVISVSACTSYSSIGRTDSQASDNTLVLSSDFEYENDEEVIQQMLRVPSKDGDEFKCDEAGVVASWVIGDAETPPLSQPLPKLNRGVYGSKPTLPVDSQKINGIKTYARIDSEDSQKPFSPVFF